MLLATKLNRQLKTELAIFRMVRNISLGVTVWLLGMAYVFDKRLILDMYNLGIVLVVMLTGMSTEWIQVNRHRSCGNKYRDFIILYYLSYRTSPDMGEISDTVAEEWDRRPTAERKEVVKTLTWLTRIGFVCWIVVLLAVPHIAIALS